MTVNHPKEALIIALDVPDLDAAKRLAETLAPHVGAFKVGLELLTAAGAPAVVAAIRQFGVPVFYDGKFDDIPNTMAGATRAAAARGAAMYTVHASAGASAMRASAECKGQMLMLAVTVLTSMDDAQSVRVFGAPPHERVLTLAADAAASGADGIVCSPRELALLDAPAFNGMRKVTPGIRPSWAAAGDQARITTPAEAIRAGATHLVIGRPVTAPPASVGSRADAAKRIADEIADAC